MRSPLGSLAGSPSPLRHRSEKPGRNLRALHSPRNQNATGARDRRPRRNCRAPRERAVAGWVRWDRWPSQSLFRSKMETGRGYLVHRHGFMCGVPGVQLGVGFQQRLGAGIFGGTGFRMQRLTGHGMAWVELHGEVVHYELPAGNTLRVHPGHVALFEETVDFNVTTMPGIRNALFGGDGLFRPP